MFPFHPSLDLPGAIERFFPLLDSLVEVNETKRSLESAEFPFVYSKQQNPPANIAYGWQTSANCGPRRFTTYDE